MGRLYFSSVLGVPASTVASTRSLGIASRPRASFKRSTAAGGPILREHHRDPSPYVRHDARALDPRHAAGRHQIEIAGAAIHIAEVDPDGGLLESHLVGPGRRGAEHVWPTRIGADVQGATYDYLEALGRALEHLEWRNSYLWAGKLRGSEVNAGQVRK
jgi:hypothetical protein